MSSIIRADKWQNALGVAYNTVLQVVQTVKTDTFSTTSTSFTDVTGLSVSITPKFDSSKILILAHYNYGVSADGVQAHLRLMKNSTEIYIGDAAGSRIRSTTGGYNGAQDIRSTAPIFLDSPNTTSTTVYKVQMRTSSGTSHLNRSGTDSDTAQYARNASSITVIEIAQ